MKLIHALLTTSILFAIHSHAVTADDNSDGKKPKISDIQTIYDGDKITITINGISFLGKKGKSTVPPYLAIGNGLYPSKFSSDAVFEDSRIVLHTTKAALPSADYLVWISKDDKFSSEKSDFYDLTIGAVGPKGDTGANGLPGQKGEKGDTGQPGLKGDKGDQGLQGKDGLNGAPGKDGSNGKDGAQGLQGEKGGTGSFPNGEHAGDMQYWDGAKWVMVPVENSINGSTLTLCNGVPKWGACDNNSKYVIGAIGPAGGKIFYVDASGKYGLEAAPTDFCICSWYAATSSISTFNLGGVNDWRLPTLTELRLLYEQQKIVGYFYNNYYWSSTEFDSSNAWFKNFDIQYGNEAYGNKYPNAYVRLIRSF